jgi:nitrate reductase (NAD(P)H)
MVKVSKSDDRVSPTLRTVNKIAIIVPHQKSAGFSWGAAGVSTCRWKVHLFVFICLVRALHLSDASMGLDQGVLVRDLLLACGVEEPTATMTERFFLNFEGAPLLETTPNRLHVSKLIFCVEPGADSPSEGAYATSIPLAYAMDTTNDVLLAYAINGNQLHPDHGYPLRSIIPGYVGGAFLKLS